MGHIQIRNVPPDLHRKLKARAATTGMTLSDYLLSELRPIAELPTLAEWVAKVRSGPLYDLEVDTAEVIREAREENDRKWSSRTRRRSSTR
jgi:plasmid stability protein